MAGLKTKKNETSVKSFLDGIEDEKKRKDRRAVLEMMQGIARKAGSEA